MAMTTCSPDDDDDDDGSLLTRRRRHSSSQRRRRRAPKRFPLELQKAIRDVQFIQNHMKRADEYDEVRVSLSSFGVYYIYFGDRIWWGKKGGKNLIAFPWSLLFEASAPELVNRRSLYLNIESIGWGVGGRAGMAMNGFTFMLFASL